MSFLSTVGDICGVASKVCSVIPGAQGYAAALGVASNVLEDGQINAADLNLSNVTSAAAGSFGGGCFGGASSLIQPT